MKQSDLKKPKKVVIERSRWAKYDLVRDTNRGRCMCALGWYLKAAGYPEEELQNRRAVVDIPFIATHAGVRLGLATKGEQGEYIDTEWADAIAAANDGYAKAPDEREEALTALFRARRIKLEFVD